MKITQAFLLSSVVVVAACGDDGGGATALRKGEVDVDALSDGWSVELSGPTGTVEVPFVTPAPDVDSLEFQDEVDGAVSLIVQNPVSGVSVDLAVGTVVDGDPAAPGEFSWTLSEDGTTATFVFFNETPGGLTLDAGTTYTASLSVAQNAFVESVPTMAFDVLAR